MCLHQSRVNSKERLYILDKVLNFHNRLAEILKLLEEKDNPNPFLKQSIEKIADSTGNLTGEERIVFMRVGNIQGNLKTMNKVRYDLSGYPESYRIPQYQSIFNKD